MIVDVRLWGEFVLQKRSGSLKGVRDLNNKMGHFMKSYTLIGIVAQDKSLA